MNNKYRHHLYYNLYQYYTQSLSKSQYSIPEYDKIVIAKEVLSWQITGNALKVYVKTAI